jgi:hypothetical protein
MSESKKDQVSTDKECQGQVDRWPGEKLRTPGVKDEKTIKAPDGTEIEEKTTLPILPNHPTATGQ